MRDDFAVFILTHGRADRCYTYKLLEKCHYDGALYFLVDNEDADIPKYKENFGSERVIIFDKEKIMREMDTMDLTHEKRSVVFARNAAFKVARDLGLDYFLTLDDDYTNIHVRFERHGECASAKIKDIKKIIQAGVEFLKSSKADVFAFCQGGDLQGGINGNRWKKQLLRKAMNALFFRTDRPIKFIGTINEDVTAYALYGSQGKLFFTDTRVQINQMPTQTNAGGMTELYKDDGTYLKSFYTVMAMPSAVKVESMSAVTKRLHHHVYFRYCAPLILNEKYKK